MNRLASESARRGSCEVKAAGPILAAVLTAFQFAVADDFKTVDGKEYKNAKVSRVEPDGIVLKSKSGISKLYFTELPKAVQERFHYDAAKGNAYSAEQNANLEALRKQQEEAMRQRQGASPSTATDFQAPTDLMKQAESALWKNQFAQSAELLNRIASEYPASPQAKTVRDVRSFLRDKQPTQDGPLTASEAQRLRSVMDALAKIKQNYRTATPEKRRALETILGAETFQDTDEGLGSLSSPAAKLRDSVDKARQGQ
jgi:hypothetical protein